MTERDTLPRGRQAEHSPRRALHHIARLLHLSSRLFKVCARDLVASLVEIQVQEARQDKADRSSPIIVISIIIVITFTYILHGCFETLRIHPNEAHALGHAEAREAGQAVIDIWRCFTEGVALAYDGAEALRASLRARVAIDDSFVRLQYDRRSVSLLGTCLGTCLGTLGFASSADTLP